MLRKNRTRVRAKSAGARRRLLLRGVESLECRRLLTAELEPNNTAGAATSFAANGTLEGRILNSADVDYFKIALAQGAQLSIIPDNINSYDKNLILPGPLDLLDASGALMATSSDGRPVRFVAPRAGDYYARISSGSSFGMFTESYAMQSVVTNFSGVTEQEPNNATSQATAATLGVAFRGDLTTGDPADLYSVLLAADATVVVNFTGPTASRPAVRLLSSSGSVLAAELTGLGLSAKVSAAGTYFLQILSNSSDPNLGQYVGIVNSFANGVFLSDNGDRFETAADWQFDLLEPSWAIGSLTRIDDVDVYEFEVTSNSRMNFDLQSTNGDQISGQNKLLTLSNQFGQLLAYSTTGSIRQERIDATAPGKYFLTVSATSPLGMGSYGLRFSSFGQFSNQRDVPLHFIDFDQQQPSYQNRPWVSSYGVPAAQYFIVGMLDARYDIYDIDVTLQRPPAGPEVLTSGYGNFGDIGAGGYGSGSYGERRSSGSSVNTANETSWNTLSYNSIHILTHEFGHSTGMPHGRLPTGTMGYENTTELLPIGDGFAFVEQDSRRPGTSVVNERNYLDWSLQSGSQVFSVEPNDTSNSAQQLAPFLLEMSADLTPQPAVASGDGPSHIMAGDFNNDGKRDVVVASADSNDVRLYLGNGSGGLTLKSTIVVDDLGWWEESLAVGDFNGDGRSDVAVISRNNDRVGVMLAAADGSLSTPAYFATGNAPYAVASGDVNRDGSLDLIVGTGNGPISVHLGNGNGTFRAGRLYAAASIPHSLTLADFNGDGAVDVATGNNANGISVLMNDGTGQFSSPTQITGATSARGITSGDFNRDGRSDLAAINRDTHEIFVYLNTGAGSFGPATKFIGHRNAETITAGDVNRDGILDLVSGGFSIAMVALLGNGDGTFGRPITLESGDSEDSAAIVDLNGDGYNDIVAASFFSDSITAFLSQADNPRNNRATIFGDIASRGDVDRYALPVKAGEKYTFDIDAAEFQYPLDATLRLLSSAGAVLATNLQGLDRDSGLDSIDPYLTFTFPNADTVQIEVTGHRGSVGNYRLKVTPSTAYEVDAPRVIASLPDNGSTLDAINQLIFFFDDQIDPATLTANSVVVRGQTTGVRAGSSMFNPLDATLTWTSATPLAPDTYTVTLAGGASGLKDLQGTPLDGEIAADYRFPAVSGNGAPGGDFVTRFTINASDTAAATVISTAYTRDPHQRGRFTVRFSDQLSVASVGSATFTLRGAGPDQLLGTSDDRFEPLDAMYDKIKHSSSPTIELYTRGIPDPDQYRIEAALIDAAGNPLSLAQRINVGVTVPESALFTDATQTQTGLVGSYINNSLRNWSAQADWRAVHPITGTRVDPTLGFSNNNAWGTRSDLGLTGGSDANWDFFSTQWDGWINIPSDGTRVQLQSDDSSRMWIDVNDDGVFATDGSELFNNNFGVNQPKTLGQLSAPLAKGMHRIRVQYEEGNGPTVMLLEWITPDVPGMDDGFGHGPTVIGMNVPAGSTVTTANLDRVEVTFSGAVDLSTLTTQNFAVRYSSDPTFFDGNDVFLSEVDGKIAWDATLHKATFQTANPLAMGYYLVELNGSSGGIRAPGGQRLDGEYLNTRIIGNTTAALWNESPSGDGIPGGDYRAMFVVGSSALTVQVSTTAISELGGTATGTVTRINVDDLLLPVTVALASGDTTEAQVPATITIPAGQASATFPITAVDDAIVDGSQSVSIVASATGFATGSGSLQVTDYEPLQLTLDAPSMSENGGSIHGTVTRTNSAGTLVVSLSTSKPGKANMPATVTIPAGQLVSPSFSISAVDNALADGNQTIQITATAAGMENAVSNIIVQDYEPLTMSILSQAISERGGQTSVVISRTDPTVDVVVAISTDAPDEVTVPSSITIPAGVLSSAPFTITGKADDLVDGAQTATLRAVATGYVDAVGSVQVLDAEQLELTLSETSIWEQGGSLTARIRRADPRGTLVVNLSVDRPGQISFPASVTLADGANESEPILIQAIDNQLLDGTRTLRLTATAAGYIAGTADLSIDDVEILTLTLDGPSTISERGGSTTVTVSRTDTTAALQVGLSSTDAGEASVPQAIVIPAGAAYASFTITGTDDDLLDGVQNIAIAAFANGYVATTLNLDVSDYEELSVSLNQSSVLESGQTVTGTVTRNNSNIGQPLIVTLASSDASEATVPVQVIIAAGQASASFTLTSVDDDLLDGPQNVSVTAAASGYVQGTSSIAVNDVESLSLSLKDSVISENGGSTIATLTRSNSDTAQPLVVVLTNDTPSRLTAPLMVTIPSGERTVTFIITAIEDNQLSSATRVGLTASAAGYIGASATVTVTDYESLNVTLDTAHMSESPSTVAGTVTRSNTDTSSDLAVTLTSSDTTEARVPNIVVIPAGQSSAIFKLSSVDDALLDGAQTVTITAYAVGYVSGQASAIVDDFESVKLTLDHSQARENGVTLTGTLTRSNTDNAQDLIVQITGAPENMLVMPSTVTIPGGQASTTFNLTTVDDDLLLGDRSVVLSVVATGYSSEPVVLKVLDWETLTVMLSGSSMSENGGTLTGTVRRNNTNVDAPLTVMLTGSPASKVTVPNLVTIPAGSASVDFAVTAIDNALLDFDSTVIITAASSGYQSGTASAEVTDFETLTIVIPAPPIPEHNGGVTAYVRRNNENLSNPLTVTLSSSDASEATVPATVTIPANATLATFTILSVDDTLRDGDQTVTISASAAGYQNAVASITVADDESSFPWNNPRNPLDVNNDTFVTPIDVLLVINQVNTGSGGKLGVPADANHPFYDTNADDFVTAIDVLLIINYINTHPSGEGESGLVPKTYAPDSAVPLEFLPDVKRKARDAFFAGLEAE